jgi:hypothetical protein
LYRYNEMVIREKNALKKFHWRYVIIDEAGGCTSRRIQSRPTA